MCTVTYIPNRDAVFFTSNRDVQSKRTPASPPEIFQFAFGKLLFPKDGHAGGTWIAAHENGNVAIFLNGGFAAHVPRPPYRKSRGLILLDIIDHPTPFNSFLAVNLDNIEPFTAVLRDNIYLFECRWDGEKKHYTELDADQPHIWSSVTLYDEAVTEKRNRWFASWVHAHPSPTLDQILHFHQFTGDGDSHNALLMDRQGKVSTVSVTSIHIENAATTMHYLDIRKAARYACSVTTEPSMAGN